MSSDARRALVTGTSSGIGLAIARALIGDGWHVTGADIAPPVLRDERFEPVTANLADAASAGALCDRPVPQALVHAAGILRTSKLGELDMEAGEAMWRLHVQAATRLADAIIPAMAKAGHGRVVLIGSRVARGIAGRSQYAATKAALVSLARSWAAEVVAQGVTVNVVSPGATRTAMQDDPARGGVAPRMPPIGRFIGPEEVAALVAFLLSPSAAAITGQDILVCGGGSLTP